MEQENPRTIEDHKSVTLRLMRDAEPVDAPAVPLGILTRESLEMIDTSNMASTLRNWELDLRQRTPDINAIRKFLNERYRHDKDDLDHDDPFRVDTTRLTPA